MAGKTRLNPGKICQPQERSRLPKIPDIPTTTKIYRFGTVASDGFDLINEIKA
jgi:hypothetical protein